MGALWSADLYILTAKELQSLPPWTTVYSISGTSTRVSELDIEGMDTRYGVTAWGVRPEEFEVYGDIVLKRTL